MISLQNIPLSTVLWLFLPAALLFAAFSVIRSYILPTLQPRPRREKIRMLMLRVEPIAWAVILLWIIYQLLLTAPATTALLLLLLSFPAYFWLRDYLPGLFFRYDHDTEPGDKITYRGNTYTLEEIRARGLKLKEERGTIMIVPYRMLDVIKVSKQARASSLQPYVFSVKTEATEEQITQLLLECPWTVPGQPPVIEANRPGQYHITTYTPNPEIGEKQEIYLRAKL